MKLKSVLSVCLAAATMAVSSATVFAADENAMKFGAPIDLATGATTENLTAGDIIAIPVDITSTTGKLTSFTVSMDLSDALSAGAASKNFTATQRNNAMALGNGTTSSLLLDAGTGYAYAVKNVFADDGWGGKLVQGTWNVNPAMDVDGVSYFALGWYDSAADAYSTEPEAFMICTVTQDITADELNKEIVSSGANGQLADNINGQPSVSDVKADTTKLNATQGAFKVVLDSAALPNGNWVQGLYAQVGDAKQDITACVHADGTTTYEFPVRVNSATGATDSITADIYANVTADEAGNTTVSAKKVGSVTLTMDGTVTSYNVVNGTVAE